MRGKVKTPIGIDIGEGSMDAGSALARRNSRRSVIQLGAVPVQRLHLNDLSPMRVQDGELALPGCVPQLRRPKRLNGLTLP